MAIKTIYHFTALTGGTATALDSVDGNSLLDKDRAFTLISGVFYVHQLDAASGAAESSPDVIAPDTNPGTKRWILYQTIAVPVNLTGPITSVGAATAVASQTGTGSTFVMNTSPTLITPALGVATVTSINKLTITAPATTATLTIAEGKTFTASNTLTLTATDGSTLAIGTGGTLGTAAYTATTAYEAAGGIATHAALTATHGATGAIVGTTNTQTLSAKTLTTPVIASFYQDAGLTKLMTVPAVASDTLATLAATQALTNKTYDGLTVTSTTGTLTIAALKVLTASNTLTLTATDGSTLAIGTGGTLGTAAYTASGDYEAAGGIATHAGAADPHTGYQKESEKDVSGGYVGLTLLKINFKNTLGTIISFFTNAATLARTYTFPDKDITVAGVADIAVDANLSAAAQDAVTKRHTQGSDTALGAVGTKNPPIDADKAIYRDSAASDALVTSTWTQIKAFLKTYFDTLYNLYTHPNHSGDVTSVADGAQTIANKQTLSATSPITLSNTPTVIAGAAPVIAIPAATASVNGYATSAQITKLDGIEALADVTDNANVDAAGATMNADTDVSANSWVINESNMASNLASKVPTQQSVKAYVDAMSSGLDIKNSCTVATAAALPACTPAGSGVGKTLTANAVGVLTVDDVATVLNDRVLVKDQVAGADNGIYKVTTEGTAIVAFVLTRATDFDSDAEVTSGAFTFIEKGTVGDNNGYVLTTNNPITVDTTALAFSQFSGAGQIVAGSGMTKSGNTLNVIGGAGITANADDIAHTPHTGDVTGNEALTIATDAVTYAKMQNVSATDKILGRATVGAGDVEEIACTAAARTVLDDATVAAMVDTLGGAASTGSGGLVRATSPVLVTPVLGTPASGVLTNCTGLPTGGLIDDAVTYAKIQNVSATDKILGRVTAGAGDVEEIACTAAGRALIDDADAAAQRATLGLGTIATQAASNVAITGGSIVGITDIAIADGGTGASTAQAAINILSAVSVATNEHVLTKDTATGNAIFKAGYVHPNHSGDVTSVADGATTISNNTVTNAKAAQMATKTYKGRTSAATGNAEDVPVATVKADLVLVKADVGLSNVDNVSDVNKPVSTAQQTALDGKISHSLATAVNDFLVASGVGVFIKKTLAEVKTLLDIAADIATHAALTATHGATGAIVGTTGTQTLASKTLTAPVIASFYQDAALTKLMTVPDTASDTLVTLAASQALTTKTYNGLTVTSTTGTLTIAALKVLTISNTMTLTATDGSTLAIGTGGTLGTAAYTASTAYEASGNIATHAALTAIHGATGAIVGTTNTQTLTGKRITKRTGTTTSSATPTINTDNVDFYSLTAQAEAITSFTTNLSGTPTENQTLWIAITGTAARAITWGASFEASTVALPTTTVTTARLDVGFVWNVATSKWRIVATC